MPKQMEYSTPPPQRYKDYKYKGRAGAVGSPPTHRSRASIDAPESSLERQAAIKRDITTTGYLYNPLFNEPQNSPTSRLKKSSSDKNKRARVTVVGSLLRALDVGVWAGLGTFIGGSVGAGMGCAFRLTFLGHFLSPRLVLVTLAAHHSSRNWPRLMEQHGWLPSKETHAKSDGGSTQLPNRDPMAQSYLRRTQVSQKFEATSPSPPSGARWVAEKKASGGYIWKRASEQTQQAVKRWVPQNVRQGLQGEGWVLSLLTGGTAALAMLLYDILCRVGLDPEDWLIRKPLALIRGVLRLGLKTTQVAVSVPVKTTQLAVGTGVAVTKLAIGVPVHATVFTAKTAVAATKLAVAIPVVVTTTTAKVAVKTVTTTTSLAARTTLAAVKLPFQVALFPLKLATGGGKKKKAPLSSSKQKRSAPKTGSSRVVPSSRSSSSNRSPYNAPPPSKDSFSPDPVIGSQGSTSRGPPIAAALRNKRYNMELEIKSKTNPSPPSGSLSARSTPASRPTRVSSASSSASQLSHRSTSASSRPSSRGPSRPSSRGPSRPTSQGPSRPSSTEPSRPTSRSSSRGPARPPDRGSLSARPTSAGPSRPSSKAIQSTDVRSSSKPKPMGELTYVESLVLKRNKRY